MGLNSEGQASNPALNSKPVSPTSIMRREGLTTMDYMEQLSWLLFLKPFEETEWMERSRRSRR